MAPDNWWELSDHPHLEVGPPFQIHQTLELEKTSYHLTPALLSHASARRSQYGSRDYSPGLQMPRPVLLLPDSLSNAPSTMPPCPPFVLHRVIGIDKAPDSTFHGGQVCVSVMV